MILIVVFIVLSLADVGFSSRKPNDTLAKEELLRILDPTQKIELRKRRIKDKNYNVFNVFTDDQLFEIPWQKVIPSLDAPDLDTLAADVDRFRIIPWNGAINFLKDQVYTKMTKQTWQAIPKQAFRYITPQTINKISSNGLRRIPANYFEEIPFNTWLGLSLSKVQEIEREIATQFEEADDEEGDSFAAYTIRVPSSNGELLCKRTRDVDNKGNAVLKCLLPIVPALKRQIGNIHRARSSDAFDGSKLDPMFATSMFCWFVLMCCILVSMYYGFLIVAYCLACGDHMLDFTYTTRSAFGFLDAGGAPPGFQEISRDLEPEYPVSHRSPNLKSRKVTLNLTDPSAANRRRNSASSLLKYRRPNQQTITLSRPRPNFLTNHHSNSRTVSTASANQRFVSNNHQRNTRVQQPIRTTHQREGGQQPVATTQQIKIRVEHPIRTTHQRVELPIRNDYSLVQSGPFAGCESAPNVRAEYGKVLIRCPVGNHAGRIGGFLPSDSAAFLDCIPAPERVAPTGMIALKCPRHLL